MLLGNVRWLAGYRHPRHVRIVGVDAALEVFGTGTPLGEGARRLGDPVRVLPGLYPLAVVRAPARRRRRTGGPVAGHDAGCGRAVASTGDGTTAGEVVRMSRGPARRQVVRVGDRVRFDAAEYEVVGLEGAVVRLAPARDGTPGASPGASVVLLTHLLAAADFALLSDPGPGARTGPVTVLTGLPPAARSGRPGGNGTWWS